MAERLGARENSSFMAICTAPDVCKTPVGPNIIPIPYMVIADLGAERELCAERPVQRRSLQGAGPEQRSPLHRR